VKKGESGGAGARGREKMEALNGLRRTQKRKRKNGNREFGRKWFQ